MAERTFFGTLRIAILLAVLVFVALGAWLDKRRSTDWDSTLRVTVYPIAAGADPATTGYLASLDEADFDALEVFFANEARRHGLVLDEPVRVRLSRAAPGQPPAAPSDPGPLSVAAWSLRFRYWASRVAANDPLPTPDVQVFALYHAPDGGRAVPDSLGLSKGLMAVTHLYADPRARGSNHVVLAHELLHTLGATDKYQSGTGQPLDPVGLGDPQQSPLYPQRTGEIMAGRIAVSTREAVIPEGLQQMMVGPVTAHEIGWAK
ncbi:MAG TPA: hypothetical protein VLH36_07195 [Steroidobacteraceae bacterium]|nr:hypothetical protein [Steroidobacteraceae bacterium]